MEKKTKSKKPKSKIFLIYVVFWVIIIGLSLMLIMDQAGEYNELRAEADHLQGEIDRINASNNVLEFQIEFVDSDAYIEQQARDRLRMVRPDEIVFRNVAAE